MGKRRIINRNSMKIASYDAMKSYFVKSHIDFIVLSIINSEPMCGKEIIRKIDEEFGVFISSGTMYPLLRKLEHRKLVRCERGIKKNTYEILDSENVKQILNDYAKICESIMKFVNTHAGKRK